MGDAFFDRRDDDTYVGTRHTVGPWDDRHQHGGPPAALLGRAMESLTPRADAMLARTTVEILGPVPVGVPLTVRAQVVRPGRSVELLRAELADHARPVATASAWRIRTTALDLSGPPEQPPPPPGEHVVELEESEWWRGYLAAVEWRWVRGRFDRPGPATVWTRLRLPLVAGEEPTPLQRVLAVADSGNGISSVFDPRSYLFINPELTVHLHRYPAGEWVGMEARSTLQPHGVGLADDLLYDERGPIGRGLQALLVGPR